MMKKILRLFSTILGIVVLAIWTLGPLAWLLSTSLKAPGTEFRTPLEYWPSNPSVENYATVLGPRFNLLRAMGNSFLTSSGAMLLTIILGTMSAYTIARLRFRWKKPGLGILQLAGMIPPIVVIAPTFMLMSDLNLVRTLWAMILPNAIYGIPLASFLLTTHFAAIPREIEEAAILEGAKHHTLVTRVLLPLVIPGLLSVGILVFMGSWGEYMLASTVSPGNPGVPTLPVAIMGMTRAFTLQWTWISAASMISIIPVIFLAIVFQKFIARGLTMGILK